jgi:TRAP-type mannitol/chloroaromatic compound transport system substrate-binding protein
MGEQAVGLAAPQLLRPTRHLTIAVAADADQVTEMAARRIAHRLTEVFDRKLIAEVTATEGSGLEPIRSGAADAILGCASRHVGVHPAFGLIAGLPLGEDLGASGRDAWMAIGGGQDLVADLAGQFSLQLLPAGVSSPSLGLFSDRIIEREGDFAGLRIAAVGLTARVLEALGATVVPTATGDLAGAISERRLDGVEPLGELPLVAAHWVYRPGLTPDGLLAALLVERRVWAELGPSGQAVFEGVLAQEYALAQAEALGRAITARGLMTLQRWPVATAFPDALRSRIEVAGAAVVDGVASHDRLSRQFVDSLRTFRRALRHDPDAVTGA